MEKMDKSRDLPRGLEGLRKLAGDIRADTRLWLRLRDGTESDWGVRIDKEGRLNDTLSRLADEIESERPALTDAERRVLEMWPRFEDGEPVMPGDEFIDRCKFSHTVESVTAHDGLVTLRTENGVSIQCDHGAQVVFSRPAPEVLDADGVPIRRGDTVWIMPKLTDTPDEPHKVRCIDGWGEVLLEFHTERSTGLKGEYLTHARPDSWERLEDDAREFARDNQLPHDADQMERDALDLIRRAKALAGVER